ncbi:hypothetical protein [Kitasatospora sp. NPDC057500]|uniref:hypothetical protein n=1 Tax=Kitasatospora sp. NPDC057500 TaxID=3346151 RepID=UPI0036B0F6C8
MTIDDLVSDAASRQFVSAVVPVEVMESPRIVDLWVDALDGEEVIVSVRDGSADVRIVIGGYVFDSVPVSSSLDLIGAVFARDISVRRVLGGRFLEMTVQTSEGAFSSSRRFRKDLSSWESDVLS